MLKFLAPLLTDIRRALILLMKFKNRESEDNVFIRNYTRRSIIVKDIYIKKYQTFAYNQKKENYRDLFKHFTSWKSKIIENRLVIMSGGFGKRLGSLTKKTPKGMLIYKNKPLLEHIILLAKENGIKKIFIYQYII